jgi:hypothetical protein
MDELRGLPMRESESRFPHGMVPLSNQRVFVDIDYRWSFEMFEKDAPTHRTVLMTSHTTERSRSKDVNDHCKQIEICRESLLLIPGPPVFSDVVRDVKPVGKSTEGVVILFAELSIPSEFFSTMDHQYREYLAFLALMPLWCGWHFSDPTLSPRPKDCRAVGMAVRYCIEGRHWRNAVEEANER